METGHDTGTNWRWAICSAVLEFLTNNPAVPRQYGCRRKSPVKEICSHVRENSSLVRKRAANSTMTEVPGILSLVLNSWKENSVTIFSVHGVEGDGVLWFYHDLTNIADCRNLRFADGAAIQSMDIRLLIFCGLTFFVLLVNVACKNLIKTIYVWCWCWGVRVPELFVRCRILGACGIRYSVS